MIDARTAWRMLPAKSRLRVITNRMPEPITSEMHRAHVGRILEQADEIRLTPDCLRDRLALKRHGLMVERNGVTLFVETRA